MMVKRHKRLILERRERKFGVFISKNIKKIGKRYFFVKVYEKNDQGLNYLSFNLKDVEHPESNYKINFNQDENKLLNTDGKMLHQYLIEKLTFDESQDEVYLDIDKSANYVKVEKDKDAYHFSNPKQGLKKDKF